MALLLGSPGVGKTLLSKRLHSCSLRGSYTNLDEAPATIPTVGTNLVNLIVNKKQEITIRELGGCMGPIWNKYYNDCQAVVFMIDISNPHQVSGGCMQLLSVLTDEKLQSIPILILLNKIDLPNSMKRIELESLIRLDDILQSASQTVEVVEVSAREGTGLQQVAAWIQDKVKLT